MGKSKKYYHKRFEQIPFQIIACQYNRNRWVLEILDKELKDPAECGVKFFHFLVAKMIQIGEGAVRQVIGSDIALYDFLKEHETRKRKRCQT